MNFVYFVKIKFSDAFLFVKNMFNFSYFHSDQMSLISFKF